MRGLHCRLQLAGARGPVRPSLNIVATLVYAVEVNTWAVGPYLCKPLLQWSSHAPFPLHHGQHTVYAMYGTSYTFWGHLHVVMVPYITLSPPEGGYAQGCVGVGYPHQIQK